MKRLLTILSFLTIAGEAAAQQNPICCPEFYLQPLSRVRSCPGDTSCSAGGSANPIGIPGGATITACKNSTQTYYVYPNQVGFTYTWTITGGTPASFTGNPANITWGNAGQGTIQVIVSNASGDCRDTVSAKVCLLNSPVAAFTVLPGTTVCANSTPLLFNAATSLGASTYSWDFGDGSNGTGISPTHVYTTPGNYTVILTVSNAPGGGGPNGVGEPCGCTDTATMQINVLAGTGPVITPNCKEMLCPGDTATYCVTGGCAPYNWTVNGGLITNNAGSCITVQWNSTPPSSFPPSVSVTTGCGGPCGSSATLNVPVLYNNIPVNGNNAPCLGSSVTYSLPVMPGAFYTWTVAGGGGVINGPNQNTPSINVTWNGPAGPATVNCSYYNPLTGCSGSTSYPVNVKRRFVIGGPATACANTTTSYSVSGGGTANWSISPLTGYTISGASTGVSSISVNWTTPGTYTILSNAAPAAPFCNPSSTMTVVVKPSPVLNAIAGPNPVCPSQLTSYSVSSNISGGNFNWQITMGGGTVNGYGPSNSNASANFTGAGPWTLQAQQTVNGCTGTTTLVVNKVAAPPAITLSPGSTVCSGGTVTASVTGSVPPGGYTWSSTPGAVLTGGQGTTSATFTVNSNATITLSNCSGSSSVNVTTSAATVSITQTPGPCSATLTASPGGGTYSWFLNGNPYGSGNPITVNQNGTYVVQATYSGGCQATAQIVVTGITPVIATISASGNICSGPVTLQAPIPANCPGATFTWSNGATGNPITVSTPGSYFVTVNCSNGCSAVSNTITIAPCPGGGMGSCIQDAVISGNNNCNNPVALTATAPGCTVTSTSWNYGDGYNGSSGNHYYNNPGTYTVNVAVYCSNGTVHCASQNVTVPMVDSFTHVITCGTGGWNVQLQDASLYLPAYSGYARTWSTTCGTLSSTTAANPVLTVPVGCNPTVTLTITKSGCTLTKSFTFSFPTTAIAINGPSTVCKDAVNSFSSSYTTGIISYNWNFGDATSGVTNPISHAYNGSPANPVMTLTLKDQYGCIFTATKNITVLIPPALTITPSPLVQICPDCTTPVTLSTNPSSGFSGFQWYQNGNPITGANGATYQLCNYDASGNYTVTAVHNGTSCPVKSDTVKVVYLPKPLAKIEGQSLQCVSAPGPYTLSLQNSGGSNPNYTYNWSATGPGTISFAPDNLQYYASATVSALGTYQFILTVTDITTGCVARDTFCVIAYLSPALNVTPATGICEGTMYTFNATPFNPAYYYQWSNGVTGGTMSTSLPGMYFVTVTDPQSGCSNMAYAGTILPKPSTILFPVGCLTLCDTTTLSLIPPLPLGPGQNYSQYNIVWLNNGVPISPQPSPQHILPLAPLGIGTHNLSIIVTLPNGCSDTSKVFTLTIKSCKCDCKGSKWESITLTEGPGNPPPPVDGKAVNVGNQGTIKLDCKGTYTLKCKKTYNLSASFICADKKCPPKVTYSLQPPTGPAQTGNVPFSFTPTQSGSYTLTLYGWCGDVKCDSCVITFKVNCEECACNPQQPLTVTLTTNNAVKKLECGGSLGTINCKDNVVLNGSYSCIPGSCPAVLTYTLSGPQSGTGNLPLTLSTLTPGSYTVVVQAYCNNVLCKECKFDFKVECNPPPGCCPYKITAETGTLTLEPSESPKATIGGIPFTFGGISGVNFTEVRAEVLSYDVGSNYNNECFCKTMPFTWASIQSAGNIGPATPQITLFNSVTHPFAPSGNALYQNPREAVWSNGGSVFTVGGPVNLSFWLPPAPGIDCCELSGRICVKFTFRDDKCKECEVVSCFRFTLKKK